MKTSIKTLITLTIALVALTSSTVNVKASVPKQITVLTEVKKLNKINVSGNVELILVQSANESVKVYDSYFSKNALVQQKNGELRISSFNKETLTVVVYVSDLTAITASDNSTVKTYGKFNALSLDVILKDKANAVLNTNTINLFANLNGLSSLTLSGTSTEYNAIIGSLSKVSMSKFIANVTSIQSKNNNIVNTKLPKSVHSLEDIYNLENS